MLGVKKHKGYTLVKDCCHLTPIEYSNSDLILKRSYGIRDPCGTPKVSVSCLTG